MTSISIKESVRTFLKWAEQRFAPSTVKLYKHYLYRFVDTCGKENVSDLKRLDIETFSVKKHPLEIVRRWLRWCVDVAQVVDRSPAVGVDVPKSGRRSRILTRREKVLLRRRSRPHLRALLLALQETGARPIEIRQASWEMLRSSRAGEWNVNDLISGNCYFELESYKGRARRKNQNVKRIIPISARLGRLLNRLFGPRSTSHDEIFLAPMGKSYTRNALRMAIRRLREKVEGGTVNKKGPIVPYCYRHTLATMLANQRTNARLLADLLGHSSTELLGWYVHASTSDLCDLLKRRMS